MDDPFIKKIYRRQSNVAHQKMILNRFNNLEQSTIFVYLLFDKRIKRAQKKILQKWYNLASSWLAVPLVFHSSDDTKRSVVRGSRNRL